MTESGERARRLVLEKNVRELLDRVDALEQLRGSVGEVAAAVEALAARQEDARPAPIHWPDLDEEKYALLWPALLDWMRTVLVARYPNDAKVLLPCWWEHPDAVDALTAGWQTWRAAYRNPAAEASTRADWQGRWRPQMTDQVRTALSSCRPGEHVNPPTRPDVVDGDQIAG